MEDPGSLFADSGAAEQRRVRPFPVELAIDFAAGPSVHQTVMVQLGVPGRTNAGVAVPVTWPATGREHLLPTFDGEVHVVEDRPGHLSSPK